MPIARELRHLYQTESWQSLLALLKKRSKNRCEWCGKPNGAYISTRTGKGYMFWRTVGRGLTWRNQEGLIITMDSPDWEIAKGLKLRHIRVVCTGAHLNHIAGDDRPENAAFLCQWHHLHHDKAQHWRTFVRNRDARRTLLQEASA